MKQQTFQPRFSAEEFNGFVVEALDSLPQALQQHFDNVEVVVSDWPTQAELESVGLLCRNSHPVAVATASINHAGLAVPLWETRVASI
jgi:predicted Zn-dependent protease with MMP-like domain